MTTAHAQAHPLCWPDGWQRIAPSDRTNGRFRGNDRRDITITQDCARVIYELGRIGVHDDDIVVSTNTSTTVSEEEGER